MWDSFLAGLDHLLHVGIGPWFLARNNQPAYPLLLCALVVTILLSLLSIARRHRVGDLISEAFRLVFIGALIVAVWHIFVTAAYSVPFGTRPAASAFWWLLPARATYDLIGHAIHVVLTLLLVVVLVAIWQTQASRKTAGTEADQKLSSASGGFVLGVPLAAVSMLAESQAYPGWFVLPVELLTVMIIGWLAEDLIEWGLTHRLGSTTFDAYVHKRQRARLAVAAQYLVFVAGLLAIAYTHTIELTFVQVTGLYLALIWLDNIVAAVLSSLSRQKGDYVFLSPRRWLCTIPLTLLFSTLGASGVLELPSGFPVVRPDAWAQAGAAAAAYMLFKPLVDLARYTAGVRERAEDHDDNLDRLVRAVDTFRLSVQRVSGAGLTRSAKSSTGDGATGGAEPSDSDRSQTGGQTTPYEFDRMYLDLGEHQQRELNLFQNLNFRTGLFFLVALLGYHLLLLNLQFGQSLNNALVTLTFGIITLVAGILNLLNNKILKSTTPVFLLLVFVISGIAGLATLAAILPAVSAIPGAAALTGILQGLLVFLTLGQLAYLYRLVDATIRVEQLETRDRDSEGRFEFAYSLYSAKQYPEAVEAFRSATRVDPYNANAWHLIGYAYGRQGEYREALPYIDRAIEIASGRASGIRKEVLGDYYDSRGEMYLHLDELSEALTAFDRSLTLRPDEPTTLRNKALALRALGRESEALVYEKKAEVASPTKS